MLTTCTACGTQFRVTTAQLRVVHGLVRCSRCHSVFDAFETLREEYEAAPSAAPVTPAPALEEAHAPENQAAAPAKQEPPPMAAPPVAEVVEIPDLSIEPQQEQQAPPMDDLFAELWGETTAPAKSSGKSVDRDTPLLIEDHIPKPPELARDAALYKHAQLPPSEHHAPAAPRRPLAITGWGIGITLLALVLGLQVVNANRLALSHNPVLGSSLSALYTALGHPLSPSPALGKWLISNINVTSDPDTPGALSITGALQNSATFAQPWPLLRVELTDRYGDPLQARDFTAGEYLPVSQANTWLGPGMATRFRIDVVDPGPEAVGFQVQSCLDLTGIHQCSSHAGASD